MLIADAGFFYALADRADRHHRVAVDALQALSEPLITTWPVLTEATHLMQVRLSAAVAIRFMEHVADGLSVIHAIDSAQARAIAKLMKKYADLPMDLADASLVMLAEHLDDGRILSTDQRDFKTYRFKSHKPFRNLLLTD
jgi:predicted nucleic acid-binding protein